MNIKINIFMIKIMNIKMDHLWFKKIININKFKICLLMNILNKIIYQIFIISVYFNKIKEYSKKLINLYFY